MFKKEFLIAAAERAARTFFQAMGGFLTAGAILQNIDWKVALGTAGAAALYSFCMSCATGLPEVYDDTH